MKVLQVARHSAAERGGLRAGDDILTVNGEPLRDALDFLFATADEELVFEFQRAGAGSGRIEILRLPGEPLGVELSPDPIRRCSNRCLFCFIDQNPKGMRRSLYVKDEDYRHSLLYGNYLTLTNLRAWDIERILRQRISPLYVSVHATDAAIRRRLLGCRGDGEILATLRRLAAGGIEIHAQIVVVPGHNDGPILQQTLNDLEHLAAAIRSVAIVPVGLTRHREGLPPLRLPDEAEAAAVIAEVAPRQKACLARHGRRLHFLADEFYLLAGEPLPAAAEYEGYPQIENGVGMVRRFEEDHAAARRLIPWPRGGAKRAGASRGGRPRVLVATGERFAPLLAQWLGPKLSSTGEGERFRVETVAVRNEFFGPTVTTAGLLTGGDLLAGLRAAGEADMALIPPETLDGEGRLLDDQTPEGLSEALGIPVSAGFRAPPARGRRRAGGER